MTTDGKYKKPKQYSNKILIDNAFDINSIKELIKIVVNEAKDPANVINVELKCNEERFKRHAIKFLLNQEEPTAKTKAEKIEEMLKILTKDSNCI